MSAAYEMPPEIVEPVAAISDFVTVLTSRDRLLTKQIYQNPNGTFELKDFDGGYEFDMATHAVAGLEDLHRLYDSLTAAQCVVLGRIIGNEDLQQVRRLKYPDGDGDPARLEDAAHNYIPIDLDSIPKPDDLDPIADPEGAVRYVVETVLPREFHDVTCSWRHTSSAGIKPGIRMRLNFWGDRQTTGRELRRWLGRHNIDSSIYTCNQPIYAAAPKLLTGVRDPIHRRSGIYRGQYDIVAVPDIPVDEPRSGPNGGGTGERPFGYTGFCALIGDHEGGMGFFEPIKKAAASWIATQGAGADLEWLRTDLERVIKAAPRDKALHDDKYIEKRIKDLKQLTTRVDCIQAVDEAKRSKGPPWQIKAGEPYATAKRFRELRHSADGAPTLYHHRGGFYAWNGSAYPEIEAGEIRASAYAFLDECVVRTMVEDKATGEKKLEIVPVKPNTNTVNNLLDALRAVALLPATVEAPAWLNAADLDPRDIIACANGLLHLPTTELLPLTPQFFTHNALGYSFERDAPEPVGWLAFLTQLWPQDPESIETLQEIFGYCLGADTNQQKAFLIVGPKRSGKGTIARVLTAMVGAENMVAPTLAGIGTNFGLAPLIGKRVAIISDARLGGRADQAAIAERLLSISGEDGLTIDRKYREGWTGRLQTRFLILSNELPRLNDASGALASRFIVLVLTESFFGREDPGLTNKLMAELPGILNWAIEGWQRLRKRGYFLQPESAQDSISALEDLGSPIGAFLRDACEVGGGKTATVDEIYAAWDGWCEDQGQKPGTKAVFGKELRAALPGLKMTFPHEGSERVRTYVGVGLKPAAQPEPASLPAVVKWYNPTRGFGFVTLDGGDAMLPAAAVGGHELADGQAVKVSVENTRRGRRVIRMEVICVEPVPTSGLFSTDEVPF